MPDMTDNIPPGATSCHHNQELALRAKALWESATTVIGKTTDPIIHHRLAEVIGECKWCVQYFGQDEEDSNEVHE